MAMQVRPRFAKLWLVEAAGEHVCDLAPTNNPIGTTKQNRRGITLCWTVVLIRPIAN